MFGGFGQLDGTANPVSGLIRFASSIFCWMVRRPGCRMLPMRRRARCYRRTHTSLDLICGDMALERSVTVAARALLQSKSTSIQKITLALADPTFGNTIASAAGATYSGLSSSEGGKVWTIESITINPHVEFVDVDVSSPVSDRPLLGLVSSFSGKSLLPL